MIEQPTVVVIGGGYGDVNVARSLDADTNVVLVEPKAAFVHTVASLRALVDPAFLPRIFPGGPNGLAIDPYPTVRAHC